MTEFTKGEWEIFGDWGIRAKKSDRQLSENNCHATFEYDRGASGEGFANAHLITAAPDMYTMLKNVLDNYETDTHLDNQIEVILKKARGE